MSYNLAKHPKPSNRKIRTLLVTQRQLVQKIDSLQSSCKHHFLPISYTESNVDGCYKVGIFDISADCRKCTYQTVIKNSPPICSCCGNELELKVWEGRSIKNATPSHVAIWKREHARREKLSMANILSYPTFFTQVGLYVCVNKLCKDNNKANFYITGGD